MEGPCPITSTSPGDSDFDAFVRYRLVELQRDYYRNDSGPDAGFATIDDAGSLDVDTTLMAASPEIVSLTMGTSFYQAGMAHGNIASEVAVNWSRTLHRALTERDIFARRPDRALRRLALDRFDNRNNLTNSNDPEGIPLHWDRATIGQEGVTWSFSPYELGGYLSAGSTTLSWTALEPYLSKDLPFSIKSIRDARE